MFDDKKTMSSFLQHILCDDNIKTVEHPCRDVCHRPTNSHFFVIFSSSAFLRSNRNIPELLMDYDASCAKVSKLQSLLRVDEGSKTKKFCFSEQNGD